MKTQEWTKREYKEESDGAFLRKTLAGFVVFSWNVYQPFVSTKKSDLSRDFQVKVNSFDRNLKSYMKIQPESRFPGNSFDRNLKSLGKNPT